MLVLGSALVLDALAAAEQSGVAAVHFARHRRVCCATSGQAAGRKWLRLARMRCDSFPAASERFGNKIVWSMFCLTAFMRAILRGPTPHSLRQHGFERLVVAPEMVVKRR